MEVLPATVIREYPVITSVLKCAKLKWKWLLNEPYKNLTLPKKPPSRDRQISESEIDKVLDALQWVGGDTFMGSSYHYTAIAFDLLNLKRTVSDKTRRELSSEEKIQ